MAPGGWERTPLSGHPGPCSGACRSADARPLWLLPCGQEGVSWPGPLPGQPTVLCLSPPFGSSGQSSKYFIPLSIQVDLCSSCFPMVIFRNVARAMVTLSFLFSPGPRPPRNTQLTDCEAVLDLADLGQVSSPCSCKHESRGLDSEGRRAGVPVLPPALLCRAQCRLVVPSAPPHVDVRDPGCRGTRVARFSSAIFLGSYGHDLFIFGLCL